MKKVVLITGGTGFAGSHLIEALRSDQALELHTTTFGQSPEYFTGLLPAENIHRVDLTQAQTTAQLIKALKPDQIYHLASFAAAGSSFIQAEKILINNTLLQLNLLEATRLHAPKARILSICSADEYGLSLPEEIPIDEAHPFRPVNPYAVSKISQDMLAHVFAVGYHLDIVRARPFNHIGERQTAAFAVAAFAQQIAQIEAQQLDKLKVGNLEGVRDFTDVKDMVKAYQLLMERGKTGEVYNLGSGQGIAMQQVLDRLIKLSNQVIKVEVDASRMRPSDIKIMVADISKIKALGWQAKIPLDETLKRVLDYWRGQR